MNAKVIRALVGGVLIGCAVPSWAHEPAASLEQLLQVEIESASRFAQPLAEAPSAVGIVTADDIRQYGFRTIGEALQGMRGVYATNERDYTYLGLRGFARPGDYNTRLLLLTDGTRRNDPLYDSAAAGNEAPIELDWVKRLEFVPGPSSALYGQNAIFGVANAVMWSGADIDGTRLRADLGSGNMARLGLLAGRGDGRGDWLVGVSAYGRQGGDLYFGEFDRPASNNGWARGLDGERYLKAIAKGSMGSWQADLGYSARRKNLPTAYYGTRFNAPGTYVDDQWAYADLSCGNAFSPSASGTLRFHAGAYRFAGRYAYAGLDNRDEAAANWAGVDGQIAYTGLAGHKLVVGAELQDNLRIDQRNFDLVPHVDHLDDRRSGIGGGVFVQDEWRFDARWLANLGLRADHVSGIGALSPRLALIRKLDGPATLKFVYGRSFRPPNAYEHYYNDGNVTTKASPGLGPERITMQEAIADFALSPSLRLSGSYYHYRLDGLIEQVTDPADGLLVFVNRPTVHTHGIEFEAEALLVFGLRAKGSIALQRVEQDFGPAPNSPPLLAKLLADGPLPSTAWTLGLDVQSMGGRYGAAGGVPAHATADLVARRKAAGAGGEWTVGIYNLAGRRTLDPASAAIASRVIAQDGRQIRVGWEVSY